MTYSLTPRQRECLEFIKAFIRDNDGLAPTFDQIKDGLAMSSKSGVYALIEALKTRGYVRAAYGRRRSLAVVEDPALRLDTLSRADLCLLRDAIDARLGMIP